MENRKLNKIKIGFVICVLLLVLLIIFVNTMKKEETEKVENIIHIGSIRVKMTEKSVSPENFDAILENLPMKYIIMHSKVQDFCLTYLKEVYSALAQAQDSQIKQYYEKNREKADEYLYHANQENFQKFVSQIRQMKSDTLTYIENSFEVDSLRETEDGYSFKMKVKYENEADLTYMVHMTIGEDDEISEDEIGFEPVL